MVSSHQHVQHRGERRPTFTPAFIEPECWRDVERWCAARYIECRLRPEQAELDYLMAFSRSGAKVVGAALARALAHAGARQRLRYTSLLGLFESWADGQSRLSQQAPAIWLEFDGIHESSEEPFPSLSVCLTPGYSANQPTFPNDSARDIALIDEVLHRVAIDVPTSLRALIVECFRTLPANSRWIHFSVMLARVPRALKLYGVLPRNQVLPYLDRVGWRGDRLRIESLLRELYPETLLGDSVFVDLNLSTLEDAADWSLGLAVAPQHLLSGPDADPLRTALLKRWHEAGIACPKKVTLVEDVICGSPAMALSRTPASGRFLDLKLVSSAALGTFAKAYLGFHRQPAELPWR